MKVYVKRQVAIEADSEPVKLLQQIEATKKRIEELENGEKAIEERFQMLQGELNWLRTQLSSGELVLKDAPKINQAEADAKLCQASLKRIGKDLQKARVELERMIERFNKTWLQVEASDEIR